jgi:hypothetical protein
VREVAVGALVANLGRRVGQCGESGEREGAADRIVVDTTSLVCAVGTDHPFREQCQQLIRLLQTERCRRLPRSK